MKISLNWLNDYVDVNEFFAKPDELSRLLTDVGLEVEGFDDLAKPFAHVVVGKVVKLDRHPNADRLTLCQVDVGAEQLQQIVCGAKNHKQGDCVVAALPGAVLPGDFAIKVSKIRDVESRGMLCSQKELGLSTEAEGILILPADAPVGQAFADYYGLRDIVFEINVTPNRADCLSHIGLAREISCLLNRKLNLPVLKKLKNVSEKLSTKKAIKVELQDAEQCPRYAGRCVEDVKVGPTPDWMKARLQAVGLNSINNVVDITNYVMMEYGQPLHAFDAAFIRDKKILITKSSGEKFVSLDGTAFTLNTDDLTIRDGQGPVALAGVVGGKNSGVRDETSALFIESAHFNPASVRRASRRLGIDTDSAYRFSRGTDPEGVLDAMNRACQLLAEHAGGQVAADFYDLYPKKQKRRPIKVRKSTLEDRLGYPVKLSEFASWMKRLHCTVRMNQNDCSVDVPPFRWDLEQEMDLVEEYARLNGYDKIPETFPVLTEGPTKDSDEYVQKRRVQDLFAGEGFLQAVNYHFVAPTWQRSLVEPEKWKALGLATGGEAVPLQNPLSEETAVMRQSTLPGLLQNLFMNFHYGNHVGRLFELGNVFGREGDDFHEPWRVGFALWGQHEGLWAKPQQPVVYDLKTALENVLGRLQGAGFQWRKIEAAQCPKVVHPGQASALFYQGKLIGFIGTLHPSLKAEHKIRQDAAVGEIDVRLLMQGQPRAPKLKKLSKFPSVERDLSLLVPQNLPAQDLMREMQKTGGPNLQNVRLFDLYQGEGVPADHRALAFRMTFQSFEATLSEDAISTAMDSILSGVQKKFAVKAR